MTARRKVVKKKVTKKTVASKSTSTAAKRVASTATKKKGVAAKSKPKAVSNVLVLGEALVISDVAEWQEKMTTAISSQKEIVLDGGEIEQIDGTGLQLLVSLKKEAVNKKITVSWKAASGVLLESAAMLGLAEILSLDQHPGAD